MNKYKYYLFDLDGTVSCGGIFHKSHNARSCKHTKTAAAH